MLRLGHDDRQHRGKCCIKHTDRVSPRPSPLTEPGKDAAGFIGRRRETQEQVQLLSEPSDLGSIASFPEPVKGTLRRLHTRPLAPNLGTGRLLNRHLY